MRHVNPARAWRLNHALRDVQNACALTKVGTVLKLNLTTNNRLKDVRAKIFQSMDFFLKFSLQSDNELLVSEMQKRNGGNRLRFRDKVCGKLP